METYWIVRMRKFANKEVITAFAQDFAAASAFVLAMRDKGYTVHLWDLMAGPPAKRSKRT